MLNGVMSHTANFSVTALEEVCSKWLISCGLYLSDLHALNISGGHWRAQFIWTIYILCRNWKL